MYLKQQLKGKKLWKEVLGAMDEIVEKDVWKFMCGFDGI